MIEYIKFKGRNLKLYKSIANPDFLSKTVLVQDPWEFVDMWLKRNLSGDQCTQAIFYWNQAKELFNASQLLPLTSSPLTSYYCFLNALKTMLVVKNQHVVESHGLSGTTRQNSHGLSGEVIIFKGAGILPSLCNFLGEPYSNGDRITLKDALYNLPYIHRAYTLTYSSEPELLSQLKKLAFLRIEEKSCGL
jgi:hypothetical protein